MPLARLTRRLLVGLLAIAGCLHGADITVGLNHIKLRVADLDRSVSFYYRLFGGPMAETQGGSYLTASGMRAVFMKIGSGKTYLVLSPPDPTVSVGLEHVALDRPGLLIADSHWIPHAFPLDPGYVRDPDGNLLEFVTSAFWQSPGANQRPPLPADVANRPPVFEPVTIRQITLHTPDMRRSADFYSLFGREVPDVQKNGRRFDFEGTLLDLLPGAARSRFQGFTVAVRGFDAASVRRGLRAVGVSFTVRGGRVTFHDPDGNLVEVAAE